MFESVRESIAKQKM